MKIACGALTNIYRTSLVSQRAGEISPHSMKSSCCYTLTGTKQLQMVQKAHTLSSFQHRCYRETRRLDSKERWDFSGNETSVSRSTQRLVCMA